ncbi:MAG TPA: class I SAM-dependent methyltransferase [Solirubrobacteraceae bacterium]|jgi:ubiquinone/menaquinone biosynthesis C-methylase UbiE
MPGRLYTATMGRLVAAFYDRTMRQPQEAGLAAKRAALVGRARGATLEVGAGTGLNLEHYPSAVTELILAEPGPHMGARLARRATGRAEVVRAPAERLPFPDARFDTVVATLVLCTVADPAAALAEMARVLRPGGRLLFMEHVRAEDPGVARRQDRVLPVWRFVADGCHPNRDTLAALEASSLQVEDVSHERLPKAPTFVRPLIVGSATR